MKYRTALSSDTTEPFWGAVVLSEEEFDAFERTMLEPQEPTESIKRAAELLRKIYGR